MSNRISAEDVAYIARLAHIKLSPEEEKSLIKDLRDILSFSARINELDTEGIAPLFQVVPLEGRLREDEVTSCLSRDEALSNAPEGGDGFFKVPKVIPERKEDE
jgi:aspartyl-tRNA(Asn)/glutamyl-tRNA(Gln) amidotransferase subunit C